MPVNVRHKFTQSPNIVKYIIDSLYTSIILIYKVSLIHTRVCKQFTFTQYINRQPVVILDISAYY